jgi:hydrogenase maturation protein HypF
MGSLISGFVMTSGNLSEEPIVHDNPEAVRKLSETVDGFLFHDRDIFMRLDDSVVRIVTTIEDSDRKQDSQSKTRNSKSKTYFFRRSPGMHPIL